MARASSSCSNSSASAAPPMPRRYRRCRRRHVRPHRRSLRRRRRATGPACARAAPLAPSRRSRPGRGRRPRERAYAAGFAPAGPAAAGRLLGLRRQRSRAARTRRRAIGRSPACRSPFDWGYFPGDASRPFRPTLTEALIREGELPGILGNCHASGTEIIAEFGEEHIRTGKPICYTSADSRLQIAAHETHFGLERLYELCGIVRRLVDPLNIGRVIARPFVGETAADFRAHRQPPRLSPSRRPSRRCSTRWWQAAAG